MAIDDKSVPKIKKGALQMNNRYASCNIFILKMWSKKN